MFDAFFTRRKLLQAPTMFGHRRSRGCIVASSLGTILFSLWFSLVTVGLPTPASPLTSCSSRLGGQSCGCAASKRAAGTCCCSRRPVGSTAVAKSSGCCGTVGKTAANQTAANQTAANEAAVNKAAAASRGKTPAPCCSKELRPLISNESLTSSESLPISDGPMIGGCGCGQDTLPGLVRSVEPRITPVIVVGLRGEFGSQCLPVLDERFDACDAAPPVPPPRLAIA